MERLDDSQSVMPENLTAAEMLARLAMFDQAQRRDLAWEWMAERDPEETVREILRAAASMSPRMRWLAADVAEEAGEEALPAWWEALSEPLLAVHARCALIVWDDAPELTGAEQLWLAVEAGCRRSGRARLRRGPVLSVGTSARNQRRRPACSDPV
jgi:hypothetical protein